MEELNLRDLFSLFWSKKLAIILIVILITVVGTVYSYFFVTPEYTATTSMVLVQNTTTKSQSGDYSITSTDVALNSKLVSTYRGIIKKNAILGQVVKNLNLPESEIDKIRNLIYVSAEADTEIIEIKVRSTDPQYAATIANEIAKVFSEKIVEIYNISNIYLLDKATVPTEPSNINHVKDAIIFAFIGGVLAVIYVLICNMLDTTVKTEEDIENLTDLVVLVSIPNYETEFKETKGGRK